MKENKTKSCQNCKSQFTMEPRDFEFYEKMKVPEPTFCPECRTIRRLAFRNESKLFKRKDDFTGEEIFSMHPQNAPIKVFNNDVWWSDKWDAMEYGRDYDFSKPFFSQYAKLLSDVPWKSRSMLRCVNSDYCVNAADLKNSYLVFDASQNEDCAYCNNIEYCKDCFDCYHLRKCELCYESTMLVGCFRTFFSHKCEDCRDVLFCKNCVDCSNCFGCTNLKHKQYHIFNKEYSKEEYFEKLKEFDVEQIANIVSFREKAKKEHLKYPVRFMSGKRNDNVTGDYIDNSKDALDSYMASNVENVRHFHFSIRSETKDCYDCTIVGWSASKVYESVIVGDRTYDIRFCFECWPDDRDLEYCTHCHSSANLFGCFGLNKKQYCIFNKQYTKEEYEKLVPEIKKHMNEMPYKDGKGNLYRYGEFFPPEIFPMCYNNTIAHEYFPKEKQEALSEGFHWYDNPQNEYQPTLAAEDLPSSIDGVGDEILDEAVECSNKKKGNCKGSGAYKFVQMELDFYRNQKLPLPKLCPSCRHHNRIQYRNPMKLSQRQCMCNGQKDTTSTYANQQEHKHKEKKCSNTFQTSYSPDRKEIVYCKECYQKEVE